MFRGILALSSRTALSFTFKSIQPQKPSSFSPKSLINQQSVNFTSIAPGAANSIFLWVNKYTKHLFLEPQQVSSEQTRTITKYSLRNGTRKSNHPVIGRFFRLHWGIWIRTIAGRHKKLWKKRGKRRNFLRNHVFCNTTQSIMLDKMVNKFWRKPKYYIEDPYAPYHKRETFHITRTKPWRPEGVDYE